MFKHKLRKTARKQRVIWCANGAQGSEQMVRKTAHKLRANRPINWCTVCKTAQRTGAQTVHRSSDTTTHKRRINSRTKRRTYDAQNDAQKLRKERRTNGPQRWRTKTAHRTVPHLNYFFFFFLFFFLFFLISTFFQKTLNIQKHF